MNIPIGLRNEDILMYLHDEPGILLKTDGVHGRMCDNKNRLTQFVTGERFVYVKGNFSPALPTSAHIQFEQM